jgi:hypothetical protein
MASQCRQVVTYPTPMSTIFQSLMLVLSRATKRDLARQVQYLKIEIELFRSNLLMRGTARTATPKW